MPLHFSSKDFEILDLDPPNNLTSHYGACHFGYNLALSALKVWFCSQIKVNELIWQKSGLKVSNEKLKGQTFSLGLRPRPRPSPCSKHHLFAIITNIYLAFLKKLCFFLIFAATTPPTADGPLPKTILHLGYIIWTYHINFEQNQFKDITTNIKSAIFCLNPPLGRCRGSAVAAFVTLLIHI